MKKIYLGSILIFSAVMLNAQSFHLGAIVAEANAGVDVYNTVLNVKIKDPNYTRDTSYKDKAANTNFNFGLEVGVSKRLGIGLLYKANNYFTSKDSVTNIKPEVKTKDIALILNYHSVVRKHFDLIFGANIGYSNFNYKTKDNINLIMSGGGSYASLYVNPRIYFGRFGLNFKLSAPAVNYNNLTTNNDTFNKYIAFTKWKGSGYGFSIGIQYHILKKMY